MADINLLQKNQGTVSAFHDALLFHQGKGNHHEGVWRGGIYKDIGDEFALTIDQELKTITIGTGMGMLYGRQFEITEAEEIDFAHLTGKKYIVVYIKINTQNITNENISLEFEYAGAGYPIIQNVDISINKRGIATLPLFRFIYIGTDANPIGEIEYLAYLYEPGIAEIIRSMDSEGLINGRLVGNLLPDPTSDYFAHSKHITKSDRSPILQKIVVSSAEDPQPSVANTISNDLSLTNRGTRIVSVSKVQLLTPTTYVAESGTEGYCWIEGERKFYSRDSSLRSSRQLGKLVAKLIYGKFDVAKWNPGFLGIGSKWEWLVQNQAFSAIIQNQRIGIDASATRGIMLHASGVPGGVFATIWSTQQDANSGTWVEIESGSGRRLYGYIAMIDLYAGGQE
jgi:hypothetical protein